MKRLKDILHDVSIQSIIGNTNIEISHLVFDSREVKRNNIFIAQKGLLADGHHFISKAIELGATSIICETFPSNIKKEITYIQVENTREALAIMASNFYENPSLKLQLVGVTGTNGKTTIATLLYQLFKKVGYKTGLFSTIKIMIDQNEYKSTHTTSNPVAINQYLQKMVLSGVEYCFMEVSSHGIDQKRIKGLHFSGGIFTNLSHEHLDYHKSFSEYRNVKKSFFDSLPKSAFALVNIDDKNGLIMLQNTRAKKKTYALKTIADFKAKILEKTVSGTLLTIYRTELWTQLIGSFNIYNLLAIIGTAELLGLKKSKILPMISQLQSVAGRFEYIISDNQVTAIIDYAHTPDALKNVLKTINEIKPTNKKIITVVGCGGDRDVTKRPKMANIASQLSNRVIFTSDNPRTENPQEIIEQMKKGVLIENQKKTISVLDRKKAIKMAYKYSESGDIILIAGKGHEEYQEIREKKFYFNDFEVISNIFNQLKQ